MTSCFLVRFCRPPHLYFIIIKNNEKNEKNGFYWRRTVETLERFPSLSWPLVLIFMVKSEYCLNLPDEKDETGAGDISETSHSKQGSHV